MSDFFAADSLFRNAILGGWIACTLCAVLGVYVVLRRIVLLGIALPQAGAAGVALVFFVTHHTHGDPGQAHGAALVGSLAATFGALGLLAAGARFARSPVEWRVAAVLAVASAATLLFVALNPTGDLEMTSLLRGELLAISARDLATLAVAAAAIAVLFVLFRRELLLVSFDPEFARTIGRDPRRWDALLYLLLGIAISVGVMTAGPMVVFAFLVLPALAALRLASSLTAAFVVAAVVATVSSLGGFEVAYRADLPAGPVYVLLAAACWVAALAWGRLRRSRAIVSLVALAVASAVLFPGCALLGAREDAAETRLDRGSLPDLAPDVPIAVLPFRNETGESLRVPGASPIAEVKGALGRETSPEVTVPDLLASYAARELARRGYSVVSEDVARARGGDARLLSGRLLRFTRSANELLLVRLELALLDPATGAVTWQGSARKPVSLKSALTTSEVVQDAAPAIFSEAFSAR